MFNIEKLEILWHDFTTWKKNKTEIHCLILANCCKAVIIWLMLTFSLNILFFFIPSFFFIWLVVVIFLFFLFFFFFFFFFVCVRVCRIKLHYTIYLHMMNSGIFFVLSCLSITSARMSVSYLCIVPRIEMYCFSFCADCNRCTHGNNCLHISMVLKL